MKEQTKNGESYVPKIVLVAVRGWLNMRIYFEDDEKAFLNLCRAIGKVMEENEKFKS